MSMPRYNPKRDINEGELIALARQLGAEFEKAPPLDWWCGFRGRWVPLEIKNLDGRNRYTDAQTRFQIRCNERQLPMWVWRTESDVYRDLGAKRVA